MGRGKNIGSILLAASRSIVVLSLMISAASNALRAQSATASEPIPAMPTDATPSFDVATVKPNDASASHGTFLRTNGRHVIAYNFSIEDLIAYAYGLHAKQIVDGPSALLAAHFDIDGVPDIEGHPNREQSQLMFQKLLATRFQLVFHYESREVPAYALQIAKGGSKLAATNRKPGDSTGFAYTCEAVLTV